MPGKWGPEAVKRFCASYYSHFSPVAAPWGNAQKLRPRSGLFCVGLCCSYRVVRRVLL